MRHWLQMHKRDLVIYSLGLIAVFSIPSVLNIFPTLPHGYILYLIALGLIYAIVALGLNLLLGYAGQVSLGHAGFFAIGAYTSALLTLRLGVPFLAALAAAGCLTAVVGFLLGLPALRLSGPYLAVATLGFGLTVPQLILYWDEWTGGSMGLHSLPLAAIPTGLNRAFVFRTDQDYYYLALSVLILLTFLARNIVNSDTGRSFVSIRDSEIAARAMGVNLLRYKTTAFALSAFYAGLAGSLYAHLLHGISPEDFTVFLSFDFVTMIVIGGLGTVSGGLLGAFLLTLLQNTLTRLPVVSQFKNLYIVVLGVVLILTIMFFPQGLAGGWRSLRQRWSNRQLRSTANMPASSAAEKVVSSESLSPSESTQAKE